MKDIGPAEKFQNELLSVFMRWWEESDLDELEMSRVAIDVVERFCDTGVGFDSDIDLSDMDDDE